MAFPFGYPGVYPELDPDINVPAYQIPKLQWKTELTAERFEREFAGGSRPVIIKGLVDTWPAYRGGNKREWRGSRWDELPSDYELQVGFDPEDNRMMHFGDDDPSILFNPGRLRIPAWAFLEVGRVRQAIIEAGGMEGDVDLNKHPDLKRRLNKEVVVQNSPFLHVDQDSPLEHFVPIKCCIRDLVPVSFYLSHDTYAMPRAMQEDLAPQSSELCPCWGRPDSSRIWCSNGGPWKTTFPPWSETAVPLPTGDPRIYSCFHCDRMENLHSLIAGRKEVVLVPPGQPDILSSTRYSVQRQWLLAPVSSYGGGSSYLGSTLFTSKQTECTSDQSAVFPTGNCQKNMAVSKGMWPNKVNFPVFHGFLEPGETLFIPAYHWHWVATTTPPFLGKPEDGAFAMSVNFWWWPQHNDAAMERWSFQNECESHANARIPVPADKAPPERESHAISFYRMTMAKRQEAADGKRWPCAPAVEVLEFEIVD